jgi:hypothetical protein
MLHLWLVAQTLLYPPWVAAVPQGTSLSELSTAILTAGTSIIADGGTTTLISSMMSTQSSPSESSASTAPHEANSYNCDFETMEDFFNYATKEGLNITTEVQNCQNLCLLTYGAGNPDLSGIGVSVVHTLLNSQRCVESTFDCVADHGAFVRRS